MKPSMSGSSANCVLQAGGHGLRHVNIRPQGVFALVTTEVDVEVGALQWS